MPLSPKIRVIEIINITTEFLTKPIMLIFGKGIMGTITDYSGLLGTNFIDGSYSLHEWELGAYYNVHGTYSLLFLYNGVVGLGLYIFLVLKIFKRLLISPWFLIGGYWFIFSYGFSMTISSIGIVALFLAFTYKMNIKSTYTKTLIQNCEEHR
jgi:hypothetical protein